MAESTREKPKYLAVLLKDYPFEKGENYFHLELQFFHHHFERVLLFSDHRPINDIAQKFKLPQNVDVIRVANENPANAPFKVLASIDSYKDLRKGNRGQVLTKLKAQNSYQKKVSSIIATIVSHMKKKGIGMTETVWYSYWCDELAFSLARMKADGLITKAFTRTHSHDIYEDRHPANFLPYRSFIFNQLENVLCVSDQGATYLKKRYPTQKNKFTAKRLGVLNQDPIQNYIAGKTIKLMSISRIAEVKNLESIIEVLARIENANITWHHLGSSGGSAYETSVKELAKQKLGSLNNIRYEFHGFVPPESVLDKIRELNPHFLINSSTFEGIPVSMMEACSLAIPIIGPDVCGVPEIIEHRKNGYLFSPTSPEQLLSIFHEIENLEESEYQDLRVNALNMQRQRFNADTNYNHLAAILKGETNLGQCAE